jgi:hypothetical protein
MPFLVVAGQAITTDVVGDDIVHFFIRGNLSPFYQPWLDTRF